MVPDGWRETAIGEVVEQVSRRGGDDLPVLTVSKDLGIVLQTEKFGRVLASDDRSRYKRVRRGEFAYDPMLLWSGSIARQERVNEGVVSPAYYVFSVDDELADPDYFRYFVTADRMNTRYEAISEGTNRRRRKAPFDSFGALRLPLPPLSEQRKIAAILSCVDDAIGATRKVIEQTKRVRQGFLQNLMTRGIGHTRFEETEIGEIPEEWEVVTVGELIDRGEADLQTGPFGTVLKADEYSEVGVPVISVGEIQPTGLEIDEDTPRVGPDVVGRLPKYLLREGDVVFARKGGVDRSALIEPQHDGWFLGSDGIRLRIIGDWLPRFVAAYLQRPAIQRWLEAHATGTTMLSLSQKVLCRLVLPKPSIAEQVELANTLQLPSRLLTDSERVLAELQRLKRGLLQDLLTGRVRVQPD